jgi:hypothetical protein
MVFQPSVIPVDLRMFAVPGQLEPSVNQARCPASDFFRDLDAVQNVLGGGLPHFGDRVSQRAVLRDSGPEHVPLIAPIRTLIPAAAALTSAALSRLLGKSARGLQPSGNTRSADEPPGAAPQFLFGRGRRGILTNFPNRVPVLAKPHEGISMKRVQRQRTFFV